MRTRRSQSSSDPMPVRSASGETRPNGHCLLPLEEAKEKHVSVLLHEVLEYLRIAPDDIVVDATLGSGGHARAIAHILRKGGTLIGIDADSDAIEAARPLFKETAPRVFLVNRNFRHLRECVRELGYEKVTKVFFDLGWRVEQLASGRGFSFRADGPLNMTYDKAQILTAETIVNEWAEESLADIIYGWGEERYARRIAWAIVHAREKKRIRTTAELVAIIHAIVPRRGKIDPATKTFQALRIAVNDELSALEEGITAAWKLLEEGGRIGIITFQSTEDRIVKNLFRSFEARGARRITKKPIIPSDAEIKGNPRARSAKLRVIEKGRNEKTPSKNK